MAWVSGNYYLSQSQMQSNVEQIWAILGRAGWTRQAVSALCGNMQKESTINPGIWENLTPTTTPDINVGYGLVQWTPWNKYADWAGAGWENNGPKQCERILYEVANNIQWFANNSAGAIGLPVNPPITFAQFSVSTLNINTLSDYFVCYYEHPSYSALVNTQQERRNNTQNWYAYLQTLPDPGPGPGSQPIQRIKMPIWMMVKPNYRRF